MCIPEAVRTVPPPKLSRGRCKHNLAKLRRCERRHRAHEHWGRRGKPWRPERTGRRRGRVSEQEDLNGLVFREARLEERRPATDRSSSSFSQGRVRAPRSLRYVRTTSPLQIPFGERSSGSPRGLEPPRRLAAPRFGVTAAAPSLMSPAAACASRHTFVATCAGHSRCTAIGSHPVEDVQAEAARPIDLARHVRPMQRS